MKKQLLTFAAALASAAVFGQAQVAVLNPPSLAGQLQFGATGVSATGDAWGHDLDVNNVVGMVGIVGPADSVGYVDVTQDLVDPSRVAGKIAVIHRGGGIGFGVKAIQCQRAGAIGCLIVNNPTLTNGSVVFGMAGGPEAIQVTIPTAMILQADYLRLRDSIKAGRVRMLIGNPLNAFDYDVAIDASNTALPPNAYPNSLIKKAGDFMFDPITFIKNSGKQPQAGLKLRVTLSKMSGGSRQVIYSDTSIAPTTVAAYDTTYPDSSVYAPVAGIPDLFTLNPDPNTRPGKYVLKYEIYNFPTAQDYTADDSLVHMFEITGNAENGILERFDWLERDAAGVPTYDNFYSLGTTADRTWRTGIFIHSAGRLRSPLFLESMTMSIAVNTGTLMAGQSFNAELYEWDDLNDDSFQDDNEMNLVGLGEYTYLDETLEQLPVNISIFDANAPTQIPVKLDSTKNYIAQLSYNGSSLLFLGSLEQYSLQWINADNDTSYFRYAYYIRNASRPTAFFYTNIIPSIGLNFVGDPTATKPKFAAGDLKLSPNPAREFTNVSLSKGRDGENVTISVVDNAGRTVRTQSESLKGASVRVNTSSLAPGMYTLMVGTSAGKQTAKFSVTR